jgi:hypothetical protein
MATRGDSDNESEGLQPLGDAIAAWGLPAIDASGAWPLAKGLTLEGVNIWRILKIEVYRVKHKRFTSNIRSS